MHCDSQIPSHWLLGLDQTLNLYPSAVLNVAQIGFMFSIEGGVISLAVKTDVLRGI